MVPNKQNAMRSLDFSRLRLLALGMTMLCFMACSEAQAKPYTYAPETCEFTITFPEQPHIQEVCEGGDCYQRLSFIHTFDMQARLSFRVTCNPISKEAEKAYTPGVMRATVSAMVKDSKARRYETNIREEENYRLASVIGEGEKGARPLIYIGQLWIADSSAFIIEGELIGPEHEHADQMFSEILQSAQLKPGPNSESAPP